MFFDVIYFILDIDERGGKKIRIFFFFVVKKKNCSLFLNMKTLHRKTTEKKTEKNTFYNKQHFFFPRFLTCNAARVAVSNTSRTPSFDLAEHSK